MHSTVTRQLSTLFRCDASPSIGLGHVVRCLALADELHEEHGAAVSFAMRSSVLATELVTRRGYQIWQPADSANFDQEAWLRDCILKSGAQILVVDVRDDLSKNPGERRGVRIYKCTDGKGTQWERQIVDDGGIACEDLTVADLNGDGRPDIIATGRQTGNVRIYWNEGRK